MKIKISIIYYVALSLLTARPFISDCYCYIQGYDTIVPKHNFKIWGIYLAWNAILLFLLLVINWYHRKCTYAYDKNHKKDFANRSCEKVIWLISTLIGSAVILIGSCYPYLFLSINVF